jgi:hypothetical protein
VVDSLLFVVSQVESTVEQQVLDLSLHPTKTVAITASKKITFFHSVFYLC